MDEQMQIVMNLWEDMDKQRWQNLHLYFRYDAIINWHDSNESFTVDEFVAANETYPGDWNIKVEKLMTSGTTIISVTNVSLAKSVLSFHVCSFFQFKDGLITTLDEYWGQNEKAPDWRIELGIGKPII